MMRQARSNFVLMTVYVALTFGVSPAWSATSSVNPTQAAEWRGETLKANEAAFYFVPRLQGFHNMGSTSGRVNVVLFSMAEQKFYSFSNTLGVVDIGYRELWKLPAGKYRVERIEVPGSQGPKREWLGQSTNRVLFNMPRLKLANLGTWTISSNGKPALSVKFEPTPSTYKEHRPRHESSIAAVVSGYTGVVEETFAGKAIIDSVDSQFYDQDSLRRVATTSRQISMFYNLDLIRHGKYVRPVLDSLSVFDPRLRDCYLQSLSESEGLRGTIIFKILISEKTGTMKQILRSGGSLNSGTVTDCLVQELEQIPLPIHTNINGELKMTFDYK